jgi:hypothetical protein
MSQLANNPYPKEAPEHRLWERWHQLFYAQPIAEQLIELHAHLRGSLDHFRALSPEIVPAAVNERFRREVIELEYAVNLLEEIAAYTSETTGPTPARTDPDRPLE